MAANDTFNIYSAEDVTDRYLPSTERVFISHRSLDKPLAIEIASVFESLGLHYWLDRDDKDTQNAAKLGMVGDQALVHAIDRGIRHSSRLLGILSNKTRDSWWVPYEIGASRALGRSPCYLVLAEVQGMDALPEYVRIAANYWSADELVRWASSLLGPVTSRTDPIAEQLIEKLMRSGVPRKPPTLTVRELSLRALNSIDLLTEHKTQQALQLTSNVKFDWLPTRGGIVRDLSYDLLAPLALFRLNEFQQTETQHQHTENTQQLPEDERRRVELEQSSLLLIFNSITEHYAFAQEDPVLIYDPECYGWRHNRYTNPARYWLQGMTAKQLRERLDRFFIVRTLSGKRRLTTKEEFKAEFDRILSLSDEHERRALGVLVNPLFGFNPASRPVYWRVLSRQQLEHRKIVGSI